MIFVPLIIFILFICGYYLFSIAGIFKLRKNDDLDFFSEDIISAYRGISIALTVLTFAALILELIIINK